jgi:hypothetical protein
MHGYVVRQRIDQLVVCAFVEHGYIHRVSFGSDFKGQDSLFFEKIVS